MGMTAEPYPWKREFSKEFDPRAPTWFLAGLAAAGGLLWLYVYVRDEWIELLKVSLFCFFSAAYLPYPGVTLLIARRIGTNRARLVDGKLIIGRRRWWDYSVWGITFAWYLWLMAFALWYANTSGAFADGNEIRYGRAVVMLYVGAFAAAMSTLFFSTYPVYNQRIVLDSEGVTHFIGKRALVQLSWDEIKGISIMTRHPNQAFQFETTHEIKPKKNWIGLIVGDFTAFNATGFDVEPNALMRTMRALVTDPQVRQWIGTPRGLEFLLYGPAWNDIKTIPHGATWANGKILEETA